MITISIFSCSLPLPNIKAMAVAQLCLASWAKLQTQMASSATWKPQETGMCHSTPRKVDTTSQASQNSILSKLKAVLLEWFVLVFHKRKAASKESAWVSQSMLHHWKFRKNIKCTQIKWRKKLSKVCPPLKSQWWDILSQEWPLKSRWWACQDSLLNRGWWWYKLTIETSIHHTSSPSMLSMLSSLIKTLARSSPSSKGLQLGKLAPLWSRKNTRELS